MHKILMLTMFTVAALWAGQKDSGWVSPDARSAASTRGNHDSQSLVRVGDDLHVPAGQRCKEAVAIGGNVIVDGEVDEDAVAIGGSLTVNGTVHGDAVAIGGKLTLGDSARIAGDAAAVFGSAAISELASVGGDRVAFGAGLKGLLSEGKRWVTLCLFKGRLVAPDLPWTVGIFVAGLLFAMILAMAFRTLYADSLKHAGESTGAVMLTGLLTGVASLPISAILSATVIAIPLVAGLHILLYGLGAVGLWAVLSRSTGALLSPLSKATAVPPVLAGVVGAILYTGLAMTPWVGILTVMFVTMIGTGAGVYAFLQIVRNARRTRRIADAATARAAHTVAEPTQSAAPLSPETVQSDVAPPAPPAQTLSLPTLATFWERTGAAAIDIVLMLLLYGMLVRPLLAIVSFVPDDTLPDHFSGTLLLAYLICMWFWKQSTIGGAVFGLRIQRTDGSALTPGIAVVRGLSLILSVLPLGLGYFWMQWSPLKRTWHDSIAGTDVVKVPQGVRLF